MKKVLVLTLVFLMALSSVALASDNAHLVNTDPNSIAIATELVELDILIRGNPAKYEAYENWFWRFCEKELNIKFNYEAVDSSVFTEKLNIIMSTDSMPDMIMASATIGNSSVLEWGQLDGMLLAIDEYREYCPRYFAEVEKQPDLVLATTTPDGHTYGFGNIRVVVEGQSMGIPTGMNTKWLENLGMEMPTTLDEFYNVMMAFRTQDPNGSGDPTDEVPWQGLWSAGYPERLPIYWAYGYNGYTWRTVNSTTLEGYYSPYVPEYKEIIGFLKQCWDDGILQDTMFAISDGNEGRAFGMTNLDYTYYGFSIDNSNGPGLTGNPDFYCDWTPQIPLVVDETVKRTTWMGLPLDPFTWTISSSTEYPEVCVAFCDFWYDPYNAIMYCYGPEYGGAYDYDNCGWTYHEDTMAITYDHIPESFTGTDIRDAWFSIMDGATFGLEGGTAARYYWPDQLERYGENWEGFDLHWQTGLAKNNTPYEMYDYISLLYYTPDDLEIYSTYRTPLWNYQTAQEALFITGDRDWSEFEAYQKELDDMGGIIFDQFLDGKIDEFFGREVVVD